MTRAPSSDLLTQYVTLLREFGLPREEIRALHAEEDAEADAPLRELVARRVAETTREVLFASLVETLTQSRRGVSATASYWNYAPEVHLNEVLEPYGCSVTFRDTAHDGGAEFEIELEDSSGAVHLMQFEYPETALGDDNLPALMEAVERELLADTGLTFVLLTPVDRRWRIVLLESERLAELRRQYGARVEFAATPLLRDDQPPAFVSGDATEVFPSIGETEAGTGRSPRESLGAGRSADAAELLADGDPMADPDAVLGEPPEAVLSEASTDGARTGVDGVEASDQELKRVFGDLSDVSLDPTRSETAAALRADDPPTIELGSDAVSADAGSDDEEPEGLDGLFEELERVAITQESDPAASADQRAVLLGEPPADAPSADRHGRGETARRDGDSEETAASTAGPIDPESVDAVLGSVTEESLAVDGDGEELLAEASESDAWAVDDPTETAFEWVSDEELAER
jgi:hypothetical protein